MPRPDKKRRTVHQVLEMFASLGLPVCDDEEAIKIACEEQRGTRNRELNSTKGSVAAKAQRWFDDVNTLLNKRQELLDIVFEQFTSLCDTVLRADIDGGRTTLGADTQLACRDIAMSWCRARSDVANRWINDYLELRGLQGGSGLEQSARVRDVKAVARRGRVMLTWTPPDESYDEVRILRSPDPSNPNEPETLVYQGRDASFLDATVSPKAHYVYRVYTYQHGRRSLTAAVTSTRRPKEAPSRLRPALAGALMLSMTAALLAIDRFIGQNVIMGGLAAGLQNSVTALDAEHAPAAWSRTDPSSTPVALAADRSAGLPAGATSVPAATPAASEALGTQQPAGASSASSTAAAASAAQEGEAPRAWMTRPPNLAFARRTLNLELAFTEPMQPQLFEAVLQGVAVKRVEFDVDPPGVRFDVLPLAQDDVEAQASWSFRLSTPDGRLTEPVTGSCVVVSTD